MRVTIWNTVASDSRVTDVLVLDASAMVTILIGGEAGRRVAGRIRGSAAHVPAHFDAEVLSALGRLSRAGELQSGDVSARLDKLAASPFQRHILGPLLAPAWNLRANVRLVDALYVALADKLSAPLITLDKGLASATPRGELLRI